MRLELRIESFLNQGDSVAAEIPEQAPGTRCFVHIAPVAKPSVPREEFRYLNSKYDMWQYWDFRLRRMVLRSGWEELENDYDLFLVSDERKTVSSEKDFYDLLVSWVKDARLFRHSRESACPL